MKLYRQILILAAIVFILFACSSQKAKINEDVYSEFQKKGSEISKLAQATLLSNVGKAIQTGGPEYAVEFCNLQASSIVDSLNRINNCLISRISIKNRNPENNLKSELEKELWSIFETQSVSDTLVKTNQNLVYYKTIKIAMPACLKCHGNPETDIDNSTIGKLQQLYPNDLATGYTLNDFRGLWKVEFNLE